MGVIAVSLSEAVDQHVMRMMLLHYTETYKWSRPLPIVNPNEVIQIFTKRMADWAMHPAPLHSAALVQQPAGVPASSIHQRICLRGAGNEWLKHGC